MVVTLRLRANYFDLPGPAYNKPKIIFSSNRGLSSPGIRRLSDPHHPGIGEDKGFSLVELIIVVAIIMTLVAMATPSFLQAIENAKMAKAIGDIHTLETDIEAYDVTYRKLPNTLTDVGRGDLLDPWGNAYVYTNYALPGTKTLIRKDRFLHPLNSEYDLFSPGQDGKWKAPITAAESHDDVIRANDGAYLGLASQY